MRCAVCTLFERDYHLGVAVLVNSLCRAGFSGTIYAGYRGPLPPWAEGRAERAVTPAVRLRFLPLETTAHLTNFKPAFFLQVEALARAETDALVYLDPDIVVNTPWRFIEEWITCGAAVCEDVNSPLAGNHPRRVGWRRFFGAAGKTLQFREPFYANGGFLGLAWEHRRLLEVWRDLLGEIAGAVGGADVVGINGGRALNADHHFGFAGCFDRTDQDALNAALEACPEIPVSFLGRQAMGFEPGEPILPHALSLPKPWQRRYLRDALQGRPPAQVDKLFWSLADQPLAPFGVAQAGRQRRRMQLAAALGRFIRRA